MKLIDKDKVVTEIERIMNEQQEICKADVAHGKDYPDAKNIEVIYQFQQFTKFLDTLEVKDVDIEKEIKEQTDAYYNMCEEKLKEMSDDDTDLSFLTLDGHARYFFELGLKAKGE